MNKNSKKIVTILLFCIFWGLINQAQASFSWEDNLVAHYKMNDNAPNATVIDSQGYSNGTAQQNTSLLHADSGNPPYLNGALSFNGTSDYVDTGDTFQSVFSSNFSISIWVKQNVLVNGETNPGIMGITTAANKCMLYGREGGDNTQVFSFTWQGGAGVCFCMDTPDEQPFSEKLITDWYNLVVTVEQLDIGIKATIYFNGQFSATEIGLDVLLRDYGCESNISLGTYGMDYHDGFLDNIMIFNKTLTEKEVAELYNFGNGTENIYEISGAITLIGGTANVADIVLNLSGDTSEITVPDDNGNYSFNCWERYNYIVTPLLEDYYFFPTNYSYTPLDSDQTDQDFTGLHKDYDGDGNGIPDWIEMTFFGKNRSSNDDEGKNHCFIATATYGTPITEEVRILRVFRNKYLLSNPIGKCFINTYYKISPPIADFIREHPAGKSVVRDALKPLIWLSQKLVR